ncbi:MAG TPA: glycosyltransferase family 4 protein [Candidatus Binatia bacterium]|nr:glycosyltransferase family 4 protein [Candidatus Binatia bacterium]
MRRALAALAHPGHAGMLRALRALDEAAPRFGWELRFVVPAGHPLTVGQLAADRTVVLPALGRGRRLAARLALPLTAARLARLARGADLLYAVTLASFPSCRLAGRLAGLPQVVHVYSSYGDPRPYRKHGLARARHVIAPSADSLRLAERALGGFAPGTRARVAYNGVDVEGIVQAASAAVPMALGEGLRVGMVGHLDERKNPLLLVEAAGALRATVPDLRVVLVGAFPDAAYEMRVRARAAALGLADALVVTGFLANPFPVVRGLDIVVHPARRDPFPLALLEAMALARPIVASAVGGIPEMLVDGESGLLVPPDDPPALVRALRALLEDAERRRRLGEAARTRLTTAFTLEGFAAAMFGAFDEAVGDEGR